MTFSTVRFSTIRECSFALARTSPSIASLIFSLFSSGVFLLSSAILNIQIFHKFCSACNKVLTWLNICTHQLVEDIVCFFSVFHLYLHQYTFFWVHGCIVQLVCVHFTKTLVALDFCKSSLAEPLIFCVYFQAFFFATSNFCIKHNIEFCFVVNHRILCFSWFH